MYLIFAIVAGLIGGAMSVIMRMELQEPGAQLLVGPESSASGRRIRGSRR